MPRLKRDGADSLVAARPPTFGAFSKRITSAPSRARKQVAVRPAIPPPTTTTSVCAGFGSIPARSLLSVLRPRARRFNADESARLHPRRTAVPRRDITCTLRVVNRNRSPGVGSHRTPEGCAGPRAEHPIGRIAGRRSAPARTWQRLRPPRSPTLSRPTGRRGSDPLRVFHSKPRRRSRPCNHVAIGARRTSLRVPRASASRRIGGSRLAMVEITSGAYSFSQKRSAASGSKVRTTTGPVSHLTQLRQSSVQVAPLVDGEDRHRSLERGVLERQGLGGGVHGNRQLRGVGAHRLGRSTAVSARSRSS